MQKLFLFIVLVFSVFSAQAQKFDFPGVRNTVPSVETAFLALLHNMAYLSEKSVMVDHIKYEDTNKRYIDYIDFILTNMTYEKIKSYFFQISENVEKIDWQGLSKKQQEDFEYFLNTAIVDSWTFGTGRVEFVNLPVFEGSSDRNTNEAPNDFDGRIIQQQNNISSYEEQINALPNLNDIEKTIDDAVREYCELQNSTPGTARAVLDREDRLSYLKNFEMNARRQYRDVSSRRDSLFSRISSARENIRIIELERERFITNLREEAKQNYIDDLHNNINNFHLWKEFFEDKNNIVRDFLTAIDVRGHLAKGIDEYIPQRQAPQFLNLLDMFCADWGI
jgi:hypothetical protein